MRNLYFVPRVYYQIRLYCFYYCVEGLNLRGRRVPLHTQNPRNPQRFRPDTIRIKVKNIPLSADDRQIHRTLTLEGCNIEGTYVWVWENKIMRTVYHSMTLLIA
jgi:hypothetical protein